MVEVKIKGKASEVEPILYGLKRWAQVEVLKAEYVYPSIHKDEDEMTLTCSIDNPVNTRARRLKMHLGNGQEVEFTFLDFMQVDLDDGIHIYSGRFYDIFA
ncbi:hypothetical protein [Baia soyae]|uniref:Uncharacterized protein n=1 Tax=Baia soyae TaxID=1544746 RepID=A0A4R2S062_9BACL|nr:hypothetical protein [Baia soyae]TCP69357.1 hypothetical protein EDD57_10915 [Baia soyae]